MMHEHQLHGSIRCCTTEIAHVQEEISLHTLDAQTVAVFHLNRITLRTGHTGIVVSHTVVLEGDGKHRHTIAHTLLEEELRLEIEHQLIALMERSIHRHLKTIIVVRLVSTEHHRRRPIPDIGSIAGNHIAQTVQITDVSTHRLRLSSKPVAQIHIDVVEQFRMAHIIDHRRIKLSSRNAMFLENSLSISNHRCISILAGIIVGHRLSNMKVVEHILHLLLGKILSRHRRLTRSNACQEADTQEYTPKCFIQ